MMPVATGRIGGAYSYETITSNFSTTYHYEFPQSSVLVPLFDINNDGFIDAGSCSRNSTSSSSTTGTVLRIYFMNGNGGTLSGSGNPDVIIGAIVGNFPDGAGGQLTATELFCRGVTAINDVNGDGMRDLAVATHQRLWIVMLKPDGSGQPLKIVKNDISGSFSAAITTYSARSVAFVRGFSSAVPGNAMIMVNRLLSSFVANSVCGFVGFTVSSSGAVTSTRMYNKDVGLPDVSGLGKGIANVGDYDGNGVEDLVVFSQLPSSDSTVFTFIVYMHPDGSILSTSTPNSQYGPGMFTSRVPASFDSASLGCNMAVLPDLNGDGKKDLAYSGKCQIRMKHMVSQSMATHNHSTYAAMVSSSYASSTASGVVQQTLSATGALVGYSFVSNRAIAYDGSSIASTSLGYMVASFDEFMPASTVFARLLVASYTGSASSGTANLFRVTIVKGTCQLLVLVCTTRRPH